MIKRARITKIEYGTQIACVDLEEVQSVQFTDSILIISFRNNDEIIFQPKDGDKHAKDLLTATLDFWQTWKNYDLEKPEQTLVFG